MTYAYDLFNYRPTSLLPQISKILEELFAKRLNFFLPSYSVINNSQYGFKAKTSTSHALADATHYIMSNLDNRYFTMGIFINLRKTFDTVDHNILLIKIEFYGIRGMSGDFLRSYLSNRSQLVFLNNVRSQEQEIVCRMFQLSRVYSWADSFQYLC